MIVGGVDLAAKERNPTGVCVYPLYCNTLYADEEILEFLGGVDLVAIDAPLSRGEVWRDGERELLRAGYRPLPLSMGSMVALAKRAQELVNRLDADVIETFVSPLRIPSVEALREAMGWSPDERDAYLCALTAKAYTEGSVRRFGKKDPIYLAEEEFVKKEVDALLRKLKISGPWEPE